MTSTGIERFMQGGVPEGGLARGAPRRRGDRGGPAGRIPT